MALTEHRFADFATPIRFDVDEVTVDVRGELDVASAPSLQDVLDQLMAEGAHRIVVDLAETPFVDSTGLGALLTAHRRMHAHHGELVLTAGLEAQLGAISLATVQRRLSRFAVDTPRLPRKGPAEANAVARAIPMRRIPWDEATPGHFETDLVHHGGASTAGEYIHTLQMVDVAKSAGVDAIAVGLGETRGWTVQVGGFTGDLAAERGSCRVGSIEVIG